MDDRTEATAMIAVQGPLAGQVLAPIVKANLGDLGYYCGVVTEQFGRPCTVTRTGYTGEDGFELIVRAEDAIDVWNNVFRAGREAGIGPAGLGSRDTLRLEAGMPLYGHELSEQIHPFQAGLGFAVNLKDRSFIGREALVRVRSDQHMQKRVGLELPGRRAAREHYPVLKESQTIGEVTSGAFSPTLQKSIAMAYVGSDASEDGTELEVDIRGRRESARVVPLPFYQRPRS
jgi:aminomethyltransferase